MTSNKYRILSLDGGGIRGIFPATILAEFEDKVGKPVGNYFDLIAGTSTGGIIAIALGLGVPARKIAELYEQKGPAIFGEDQSWLARKCREARQLLRGAKHSNIGLRAELDAVFGERLLGESRTRLLIPSFHPETSKVYVYKTQHHERFQYDCTVKAVDVALATSAAPTYLPAHRDESGVELIDGGVWANNPIGAATVEAIGVLGWPRDKIDILSLGTLEEPLQPQHDKSAMKMTFSKYLINMFMAGQAHSSRGTAILLTGDPHERKSIWRIDQSAPAGRFSLDDPRKIREMKDRALAEAREAWPIVAPQFFESEASEFIPSKGDKA